MHQRWRLIVARSGDAPDLGQRELASAWDDMLDDAGLRDRTAPERPKLVFAAPVPAGLTADREMVDLFLRERRPASDVRARIGAHLPAGYSLVDLYDVWLGEPALPGLVLAADYQVAVAMAGAAGADPIAAPLLPGVLRAAVTMLLAATAVERTGLRSTKPRGGNLRLLVDDVRVLSDGELWMRLRFDAALGTGRPEEVVAALGRFAGVALFAGRSHRQRLWLKGEERPPGLARPGAAGPE